MSNTIELDDLPQPERVDTVDPEELSVDGDNPNEQNDSTFGLLCKNMQKRGWLGNHIVADTDGCIADGQHRWEAAKEIGLSEVPVKFYDITDSERRLYRQELNKISGQHDKKRDALEYDKLMSAGYSEDVSALADAAEEDLDELLAEIRVDSSQPVVYDYNLDHNVYFMDCIDGMKTHLEDDSVDLIFTSPPYNVGKTATQGRDSETVDYEDNKTVTEFREFIGEVMAQCERVLKPTGHMFVNLDPVYNEGYIESHEWFRNTTTLDLKSKIIWYKTQLHRPYMPERGQFQREYEPIYHFSESSQPLNNLGAGSVWEITPAVNADQVNGPHPAPFPVDLPERAIEHTGQKGDLLLDPFMGSGTSAVAAILNDLSYVGFELDEQGEYKPVIEKRIKEAMQTKQANDKDQ